MVCKTVTLKKLLNSCPLMGKISELFKKSQSCSNIKKRNFQIFFRFRSIKNDINFINFESVKLFKCKSCHISFTDSLTFLNHLSGKLHRKLLQSHKCSSSDESKVSLVY